MSHMLINLLTCHLPLPLSFYEQMSFSILKESVADYELGFVVFLKKKIWFILKKSEKKKWKKKEEML